MRNFHLPGRSPAFATNGMAATSSPLATLAAIDVLREGGTAADAAVTASAVLCVTEPHMTGIGGDCFVLVGEPGGEVAGLNGSGRAPLGADLAWLEASGLTAIPPRSAQAVTVPGAIDAWDSLLKRYGSRSLGEALQPAIKLAHSGVPTTPRVAFDWAEDAAVLRGDEGARRHYLRDGRPPQVGESMAYPNLASTLTHIAKEGRDGFYKGDIARDIVTHLNGLGSPISLQDLEDHRSDWVQPISTPFMGREILELPPNGQGLTALIALNILGIWGLHRHDPLSAERLHLEIEAMKLAWLLRNRHIADPDHMTISAADLLSSDQAQRLAGLIDINRAQDVNLTLPNSDTVYLTVVDRHRLAISFINSIYWSFGSAIVTPATGIALQNRGACFVTDPGHPNCIGPGKRPLHTIIPALTRDGTKIDMSYGVMGGDYQPMGHVTVAVNRYVYAMDPQEAIDFPRYFPKGEEVWVEPAVPSATVAGLIAKGHRVVPSPEPLGGGQAIVIDHRRGLLIGGSDPRKDGLALGY